MLKSNIKTVTKDIKDLVEDAQSLLQAATSLTGDNATEAHHRAMRILDTAIAKVQNVQSSTLAASKEMVTLADDYVKENPWICSIDCAMPHSTEAKVKPSTATTNSRVRPNRVDSQPVGEVMMAAATM